MVSLCQLIIMRYPSFQEASSGSSATTVAGQIKKHYSHLAHWGFVLVHLTLACLQESHEARRVGAILNMEIFSLDTRLADILNFVMYSGFF